MTKKDSMIQYPSWRNAVLAAFLMVAMLSSCGTLSTKDRQQQETLDLFRQTLRFSEYDGIIGFIDSEYLEENPITRLELRRIQQFQVSGYKVRSVVASEDGTMITQVIELRLYNLRTASERRVLYREEWRWHEDGAGWRLHSGLPAVTNAL